MPHSGKIRGQGENLLTVFGLERRSLLLLSLAVLLFEAGEFGQSVIPLPFQRIRHQPVFGPHQQELALRLFGLLPSSFDLRAMQSI